MLIRARAIETECYMAAPGQCGSFIGAKGETRHTYGHSLIADPGAMSSPRLPTGRDVQLRDMMPPSSRNAARRSR